MKRCDLGVSYRPGTPLAADPYLTRRSGDTSARVEPDGPGYLEHRPAPFPIVSQGRRILFTSPCRSPTAGSVAVRPVVNERRHAVRPQRPASPVLAPGRRAPLFDKSTPADRPAPNEPNGGFGALGDQFGPVPMAEGFPRTKPIPAPCSLVRETPLDPDLGAPRTKPTGAALLPERSQRPPSPTRPLPRTNPTGRFPERSQQPPALPLFSRTKPTPAANVRLCSPRQGQGLGGKLRCL